MGTGGGGRKPAGRVSVAEGLGLSHKGAAEGLGDEVDLDGGAVSHRPHVVGGYIRHGLAEDVDDAVAGMGEVVAGEDVEDLEQDDAAGGRRRRGEDVVAAVAAGEGRAVLDLVGGQVGRGDQSPALLNGCGELGGHVPAVERCRVGCDALECARELGLNETVAGFQEVAVALKETARGWKRRQVFCSSKIVSFLVREDVALARQADGGRHVLRQGQAAVVLLRIGEAGDGAGDADGLVAEGRLPGDDIAVRVEIHVGGGSGRGLLAIVDEMGVAGVHADEHEASAADIAGLGEDDGEGETDGDGRVHRVAAGLEDFDAGVGGRVMDADHHRVLGERRRRTDDGVGVGRGRRCEAGEVGAAVRIVGLGRHRRA